MTVRDRGEYRPIYVALLDGPDFQALPAECRWTLVCVKLSLGMLGIAAVPGFVGALAERTGLAVRKVASCLGQLEIAHWIERERNVAWLVRGFEFEPAMSPTNTLHRTSVLRQLEALPRLPIVERFKRAYPEWFDIPSQEPTPMPPDSHSIAPGNTETETYTETETVPSSVGEPDVPDGSRMARLVNRMQRTSDRWAVVNLIDRIPDAQRPGWIGQLNGYLDGLDMPAGVQPSPELLATACRDYAATSGTPSPIHFRAFVLRLVKQSQRSVRVMDGPVGPRKANAATGQAALDAAAAWARRKQAEDAARA